MHRILRPDHHANRRANPIQRPHLAVKRTVCAIDLASLDCATVPGKPKQEPARASEILRRRHNLSVRDMKLCDAKRKLEASSDTCLAAADSFVAVHESGAGPSRQLTCSPESERSGNG
jgi:hypothetical protein